MSLKKPPHFIGYDTFACKSFNIIISNKIRFIIIDMPQYDLTYQRRFGRLAAVKHRERMGQEIALPPFFPILLSSFSINLKASDAPVALPVMRTYMVEVITYHQVVPMIACFSLPLKKTKLPYIFCPGVSVYLHYMNVPVCYVTHITPIAPAHQNRQWKALQSGYIITIHCISNMFVG